MRSAAPLLSIRNLTVEFPAGGDATRVLHGIDLDIERGSSVGMVGESGCGKSVTWLAVMGLLGRRARIGGRIRFDGEDIAGRTGSGMNRIRGKRIAMIFQDPASALNPVLTIGRQIKESLGLHRGLGGRAAEAEARRLLDRVGIAESGRRLTQYPHELSGGMNQRAMIAMALAGEPELLIADEPTTALDATIQAQILDLLRELRADTGMALVLVSHDLGAVADIADRVAVMYAGEMVENAPVDALFDAPRHPYTRGLLQALPDFYGPKRRLVAIPGTVPPPHLRLQGCSFAGRCGIATELCRRERPVLLADGADRTVACHHASEPAVGAAA